MKKKYVIFAALAFITTCTQVFALTLEQAVSLALENNITIKREQITLNAAQRTSSHSWNSLLPSVAVGINDELSNGFQNNFGLEGKISVSIPCDIFASINKTRTDYEAALISYEEAVSEIIAQVKTAYFSLIYEKQNLDFLKENLESAKLQSAQNEERYLCGSLSELEYLSSKVAYEKLRPEYTAQELSYKNNIKSFCLILGVEKLEETEKTEESDLNFEGTLETFIKDYTDFFNEKMNAALFSDVANGNIPSALLLKKQLESAQNEVSKLKLSAWAPSINLSYSVNPLFSSAENNPIKQAFSVGLSVPLENYLPFSQAADSIKQAEDSVKLIELQLEEKIKTANAQFSSIINELNQKNESAVTLQKYVQLAQKTYEAAKFSYSKGTMELLSMQNAAKENLEAKLSQQNEFLETLKLYIELEKLCISGTDVYSNSQR